MKRWQAVAIEDLCCLLVLGISAAAVLYPVFVLGLVPVSPQAVHGSLTDDWKSDSKPNDLVQYRKNLHAYTAFAFLNDSAQRGDSLFWNPLERTGAPFFAQWDTRCLSAFTLPF